MSSLERADGSVVTKANCDTSTETVTYVTIEEDLYLRSSYGPYDSDPSGDKLTVFCPAGKRLRQDAFNALFAAATVTSIAPATDVAAGGAVVVIKGAELDGVTGVKFDTTDGTNLVKVSSTELHVTAPAHAAGVVDVKLTDDSGTVTKAGAFTYTA